MNHWLQTDPTSGLVMPWYTHGALDEIRALDVSDKVVLEYGGGQSTRWWASRARLVYTVESDRGWYQTIADFALPNVSLYFRSRVEDYVVVPDGCHPDVVVVDGEHRTECLAAALELPRPLVLICDNWQQDFVYVDARAEEMMRPYAAAGHFHVQPDHRNHAGRPWQTAIWYLPRASTQKGDSR